MYGWGHFLRGWPSCLALERRGEELPAAPTMLIFTGIISTSTLGMLYLLTGCPLLLFILYPSISCSCSIRYLNLPIRAQYERTINRIQICDLEPPTTLLKPE